MRKETVVAVSVVGAVVVAALAWFLLSMNSDQEIIVPASESAVVQPQAEQDDVSQQDIFVEGSDADSDLLDADDVTQIIVVEPDEEISDLLSEKVIKDGKIVDKQ